MKSDDATFWQLIKHIFGFHTWGKWRVYAGIGVRRCFYRNCEICGQEQERN